MELRIVCSLFFVLSILLDVQHVEAYDDQDTHPLITEKAIGFAKLDSVLKSSLGYPEGSLAIVKGNTIINLLREGAYLEDHPLCRASNHFHNPLQPWDQSYMSDDTTPLGLGVRLYCELQGWSYFGRKSDVTWATGFLASAPSGTKGSFSSNPDYAPYNWDKAHTDYYNALTSITTADRESKFADTFSTLGHIMHLLQDMAVPAHTRNDFTSHLMVDPVYGRVQPYENYVKIFPSLVNIANPGGNLPTFNDATVTKFWDTDVYNGSNPSADTAIGLAEYANANFFSDYTIFKGSFDLPHSFSQPAWSGVQEYDEVIDANTGKSRTYLRKVGGGETINHLAATKWFYKYLIPSSKEAGLELDDKCHDDYARKLLPRAVGYSAGLLNYFFRGTIDISVPSNMSQPNNGFYALIDATQPNFPQAFTAIKLKATNTTTTGESMTNGTIQLVVKYRQALSDPFVNGPVQLEPEFKYIVVPEQNNVSNLYSATPTELNFDLSQNPIPLWATDIYLQVVFKGTLGTETDAVAVGFKDISEPTPIDIFNNMDKICINGSWYNAGSAEAIAQVDTNHNGIADTNEADVYAYDLKNIYLRFSSYLPSGPYYWASSSAHHVTVPYLSAGNPVRAAYILSDYMFNKAYYMTWVKTNTQDPWSHADVNQLWWHSAVKRQTDYSEDSGLCGGAPPCYVNAYPVSSSSFPSAYVSGYYTFRNTFMWFGAVKILINTPVPSDSACSYDAL